MAQEETFQGKRKSKPEFTAFAGKEKSMKKHKKIISLLLALVMVCSFMAMSASAAMTEVQPRGTCPNCINGYMENTYKYKSLIKEKYNWSTGCPNMGAGHWHAQHLCNVTTKCRNCGYSSPAGTAPKEYCPYNGYYF